MCTEEELSQQVLSKTTWDVQGLVLKSSGGPCRLIRRSADIKCLHGSDEALASAAVEAFLVPLKEEKRAINFS